jgi:menaquinone-dependent protoporphyrinogen oxidase
MSRVLILYATREGHTARIAARIAQVLRDCGHDVECRRAEEVSDRPEIAAYGAVIVGASIHYGAHPRALRSLLRRHGSALAARPTAFFSVSLSGGGPGAKPAAAQRYLETFLRQTEWRPELSASFAGALQYSQYGAFKRRLMRMIVGIAGGDTDMSRDYEYTDWNAVDRFAQSFAARV